MNITSLTSSILELEPMFYDDDINGNGVIDQNDVVTEQYSLQVETASFNYVTCSSSSKS